MLRLAVQHIIFDIFSEKDEIGAVIERISAEGSKLQEIMEMLQEAIGKCYFTGII